jgi:hypothetical protein
MAVQFRTVSVTVPSGTGRRSIAGSATFPARVQAAGIALNGFALDYTGNDLDRHLNVVEADTDLVSIQGNTVNFAVECNLADRNFDDPYSGYVTVLVTADVA